jgi:hypothetical protein
LVSATGVLSGQSLVIVLDVGEPAGNLFTIENLSLTVFSPTGTVLYNSQNLFGAGLGSLFFWTPRKPPRLALSFAQTPL